MRVALCAVALFVLGGCARDPEFTEVRLFGFTDEEAEDVLAAVDMWCRVSDEACFDVKVVNKEKDATFIKLVAWPKGYHGQCGAYAEKGNRAWIEIIDSGRCEANTFLASHELAHALAPDAGEIYGDEGGNLMSYDKKPGHCVTQADIDHLCAHRECNDWKPACPEGED